MNLFRVTVDGQDFSFVCEFKDTRNLGYGESENA